MRLLPSLRFLVVPACMAALTVSIRAQQNWHWINTAPASIAWHDVAYGNGLYVAVGGDATIATSPDGVTWTIRRMSTANMALNSVTYANGLFVAAGMGTPDSVSAALVMTSPDGITWTINQDVATNLSAQLYDVTYNGTMWVICGSASSHFLTSTDGLNWTIRSAPQNLFQGAYGAGHFVYILGNNSIGYSTDGLSWTLAAIDGSLNGSNPFITDLTFANGKFVAVGRDNNFNAVAYTSTDGVSWTPSSAIPNGNNGLLSVSGDSAHFIAAGPAGEFSSTDGVSWTKQTGALASYYRQLGAATEGVRWTAAANGLYFVLGAQGSITTSTDGASWTERSTGTFNDLSGLIHDGTQFVASGSGGTILTSPDGETWTKLTTGTTSAFGKIAYDGTQYVTADYAGILHSTNLTAWTTVSGTSFDRYVGVLHANNTFVAAYSATALGTRTSADGVTWSSANNIPGTGGLTNGFAFGNGEFVIATSGGSGATKVFSSEDGITWTDRTPAGITNSVSLDSVAFGGDRFVLLTSDRRSLTSPDGLTWTVNTLPSDYTISNVGYVGSQFVARSGDYGASSYVSNDGVAWTKLDDSEAPNAVLAAMVAHGNKVVGIGGSGMILLGDLATAPVIPPASQAVAAGSEATFTTTAGGTIQWLFNGVSLGGETSSTLTLANVQPENAGIYSALITDGETTTLQSAILGLASSAKVIGSGEIVGSNIVHPNGNTFDQVLVTGVAETITADAGQITRTSYIDLDDDIVQIEFSGAGTLTVVLDAATGPAFPVKYTQSVNYMKGHAGIVIVGADETTNVSVFTVGRATAFDPTGHYNILQAPGGSNDPATNGSSLFTGHADTDYDGIADIAFIAILSTDGKFGGIRTANANYFASHGLTGIYAPGVDFTGPVFIGNITAADTAIPAIVLGSASDARITGGDLQQSNGYPVEVSGLTQLKFTAGSDSAGNLLAAQNNQAVLEQDGVDVTDAIVVNPDNGGGDGVELTFFAGTNPPYADGSKKTFIASLTSLQFDSTTLTNPTPEDPFPPFTGTVFLDSATGISWEVIFNDGVLYEINLSKGNDFLGQWSK